jgi:hypothetical protein
MPTKSEMIADLDEYDPDHSLTMSNTAAEIGEAWETVMSRGPVAGDGPAAIVVTAPRDVIIEPGVRRRIEPGQPVTVPGDVADRLIAAGKAHPA